MATINTSTPDFNASGHAVQINKYDSLTTAQLIDKALRMFTDSDALALALACRLMDLNSELEQHRDDYETDAEDAMLQLAGHLH